MEKNKRFERSEAWIDEAIYDFETCLELHDLGVVSTNILPGLSYQVLPKKMHSISPVFLVVSTVFYWLSQF